MDNFLLTKLGALHPDDRQASEVHVSRTCTDIYGEEHWITFCGNHDVDTLLYRCRKGGVWATPEKILKAADYYLHVASDLGHPVQIYHGEEFGLAMAPQFGSISQCSDIAVRPHLPWPPAKFLFGFNHRTFFFFFLFIYLFNFFLYFYFLFFIILFFIFIKNFVGFLI